MNKKIIFAFLLFSVLIILIPIVQSFLFSVNSGGKITLNQTIEAPYLKDVKEEYTLMFFGYVGCINVCTPILDKLGKLYDSPSLKPLHNRVGFVFVNLMPDVSVEQPDEFAKSFHPKFKGIYLSQKQLMHIDRELGVFFSKSMSEPSEIDHSDHLYLIEHHDNGTMTLKAIYSMHPLHDDELIKDIMNLQREKK